MQNFSRIIAGCMKWGQWGAGYTTSQYVQSIEHCIEKNITSFDHADIYGDYTTEVEFGNALKLLPNSFRSKIQIISKCGIKMMSANRPEHALKYYDTSKEHIIKSCEQSLTNLHTEYLDCFLIHRPDPLINAEEVAEAFTQLKQQGKVLTFGVSNFNTHQLSLLHTLFPLVTNQIQASILHLSPFLDGTLDQCQEKKITPTAWSPVGGGNIFTAEDDRSIQILAVANALASSYQLSSDQVLLLWLLTHPSNIHPVLGTAKPERMSAAIEVLQHKMDKQDWFRLWCASTGEIVP